MKENKILIVEGIHVDHFFAKRMLTKYYHNCISVLIIAVNPYAHMKYCKARHQKMSNHERDNYYAKNW